jgi:probable F420-dependent oxidoreductase
VSPRSADRGGLPRRLRVGTILPSNAIAGDPGAVRDYAQAAEALGYDHITLFDHVLGASHADRDPPMPPHLYDETHAFDEPLVTFGYLAGVTSRIELCTGILVLPQRQTALVAKQAAGVQLLSGGRLRLGVGVGWNRIEYEALELGAEFRGRGRRIEEQIELLLRLFGEELVDFRGRFHRVDRAAINPRPRPAIPIWMGGSAKAFDRAVRLADGFIFNSHGRSTRQGWADLRGRLAAAGRDPDDFGAEALVDYSLGPAAWRDELVAWARAGGTHVSLRCSDATAARHGVPVAGLSTLDDHIGALEAFVTAVHDLA